MPHRELIVARHRAGRDRLLDEVPGADLPTVDPCATAQGNTVHLGVPFCESAAGPGLAARMASSRRCPSDIVRQLARLAAGSPGIGAKPQLDPVRHRWPHLDAPAEPVRGHRILQQHSGCARPPGADARGAALKIAPLPITERAPAPAPLPNQPQRRVGTVGAVGAEVGPARPPVVKPGEIGLQFDVTPNGRHPMPAAAPFVIRCTLVGGSSRALRNRHEAVASAHPPRKRQHAPSQVEPKPRPGLERIAASAIHFAGDADVGAAGHFDRAGQRSRSIAHASAAPHHADAGEARRVVGRPIDPAPERIGLRNSVEHQQRPARRIAAKRAKGHALAGRMPATRVGAAKQLNTRYVLQELIEFVARRLLNLTCGDPRRRIHRLGFGFGQRHSGDDDRWRRSG